ncbi:heparan-alpha-glucosaminide N-acetyltransferase domain-containing protein [Catalinimonas niigatensis]|uniref:heparan-alpha-glucosaminide N-acetyltransferase domain-containing protein n=1 Tax=Catalinimonas niigatensis TaxID=1397264 RepID=UPI0026653928|nr:DUF5009 domain-containing protein [Catalinimonas niigatensis]WPP49366.1 DUF5009 domain-containing protein [Catalinimonas niigatensis]
MPSPATRILSIDIFRGLTMMLMIFVNDFWTLEGVPKWLEHAKAGEDYLGFSDVIFPAFLFIVGLSIPFAIDARRAKDDNTLRIISHILVRTLALLVMGVYMVNLENIDGQNVVIGRYGWGILMTLAFFLIWNVYPKNAERKNLYLFLQLTGVALLIALFLLYAGGSTENPKAFQTHWWGILGLIGWAYLVCSTAYVFTRGKLWPVVAVWLFFCLFNVAALANWIDFLSPIRTLYLWPVGNGAMMAFTMGGVVASVIFQQQKQKGMHWSFVGILLALAVVSFLFGFITRPLWGVSKLGATPAWIGFCTGISLLCYAFLFWLVDMKGKKNWAKFLKPAGVSTLTCYLIPYIWYPVIALLGISLPLMLRTGVVGLTKSMLFALLIIGITALLNKAYIKLKI